MASAPRARASTTSASATAVRRAIAYVALSSTPNADKRVAVLLCNYPPGKATIRASYLNVAESISNIGYARPVTKSEAPASICRRTRTRSEATNAKIQWIKRLACGYRNRECFRNAIYFHLGGLDLYPDWLAAHTKS